MTDAVLGISWEVINAINHTKLKELDQKAAAGTITKEQYIVGILKVEADANINQEINMYSMGRLTAPKGMTQKQIINYFQDNYKKNS